MHTIVTLDAPRPKLLPASLSQLGAVESRQTLSMAALYLLNLHQFSCVGLENTARTALVANDRFEGVGNSDWPYTLNTYAVVHREDSACLVWPDGSIAVGHLLPNGTWAFVPVALAFRPWITHPYSIFHSLEKDAAIGQDLHALRRHTFLPLDAASTGAPWICGFPNAPTILAMTQFLQQAITATGATAPDNALVMLAGAVGLGEGRWIAPELMVDFREPITGAGWDDIRCVLKHRPPFSPNHLVAYNPTWSIDHLPIFPEPETVCPITTHTTPTAHSTLAFAAAWAQRLEEARDLAARGLCRPDTLEAP